MPDGVSIFADINPGMDRSGMPIEAAEAGRLIDLAKATIADGKAFRGLHVYDGHAPNFPDAGGRRLGGDSMNNRAEVLGSMYVTNIASL